METLESIKHLLPKNPPGVYEKHYITMNDTGTCEDFTDELVCKFIDFAKNKKNVLEVGCGYGTAALETKLQGKKVNVYANDICDGHLKVVESRAKASGIDINLLHGDFLKLDADKLPEIEAILFNKVLHLFNKDQVVDAIRQSFKLLPLYGRIYIKCLSPYAKIIPERIRREILNRDLNCILFPGFIDGIKIKGFPSQINIFTTFSIASIVSALGFHIIDLHYAEATPEGMRNGLGKEYVSLVAEKRA